MKIKVDYYTSFDAFDVSETAGEYDRLTIINENGWLKTDLLTECKSPKTAINRFFRALNPDNYNDFCVWQEEITGATSAGIFKGNDMLLANGAKNDKPSYFWEVEQIDDGLWYIFLNLEIYTHLRSAETRIYRKEVTKMEKMTKKEVQTQINDICLSAMEDAQKELDAIPYADRIWKRLRSCSAEVITTENYYILRSYRSLVAFIDRRCDTLYDVLRYVYGYTATSAQHITKFNHDYCARCWGCDVVRRFYDV